MLAAPVVHQQPAACVAHAVTKAPVSYPHFTTIQSAVDASKPCDWVLIAPGVYPGSVRIRVPNLHVRGLDRNEVVVDGRHRKGANGILVDKASNV